MTATNPVISISFSENNKTSFSINPSVAIPANSLIWLALGSAVPDTANVTITDSQNNSWIIQSFNQLANTTETILIALALGANALSTTDSITLTSDTRASWEGVVVFTPGGGFLDGRTIQFNSSGTTPLTQVTSQAGDTIIAFIAVLGPSSDSFIQDANWGPVQKTKIATVSATVYVSTTSAPTNGQYNYQPTLGTARSSISSLISFS